jgi:probable HAF family extracellular repeat protein
MRLTRSRGASGSARRGGLSIWAGLCAPAALCAALVAAAATPAMATTTYSITDLGNLGYPAARAVGINEAGQVAGISALAERVEYNVGCVPRHRPCFVHPERPFLWSNGTIANLGSLEGGLFAEATGINNLGEVVGNSSTRQRSSNERSRDEAFVVRSGHMTSLGAFRASVINDSGVVAGSEGVGNEGHTDAIIDSNGRITDLGLLPGEGGIFTVPTGINDSGEVVGDGDNRESMERAWVFRNSHMADLGTLGGPQAGATAINGAGEIVGFAQTSSDADHGFVDRGGKMIDLGNNVFPNAISNNGVIVGQGGCGNAIIVSGGVCRDLQSLIPAGSGYELQRALGVNDKGQIIVDAGNHALLLNPN